MKMKAVTTPTPQEHTSHLEASWEESSGRAGESEGRPVQQSTPEQANRRSHSLMLTQPVPHGEPHFNICSKTVDPSTFRSECPESQKPVISSNSVSTGDVRVKKEGAS